MKLVVLAAVVAVAMCDEYASAGGATSEYKGYGPSAALAGFAGKCLGYVGCCDIIVIYAQFLLFSFFGLCYEIT